MKRIPTIPILALSIGALMPLAGAAEEWNWSYEGLQDDLYLTDLLDNSVRSADNRSIGEIRDVMIGEDGNFTGVVVSFDRADADATALMLMEWSDTTLAAGDDSLTVSVGAEEQDGAGSSRAGADNETGVQARRLVGMTVRLSDAENFGEVVDILVDPVIRQPSALLVEAQGRHYALPLQPEAIDPDEGRVSYGFPRSRLQQLGEFDVRRD